MTSQRIMLRSKIHKCRVTDCQIDYEGSLALDKELMEEADMVEYEKILVANITNGERFETYLIEAPKGSRCVMLNGAAARYGVPGDVLVIFTFVQVDVKEDYQPRIILCGEENQIIKKIG
jgi:aspartate 1-decarboxylase